MGIRETSTYVIVAKDSRFCHVLVFAWNYGLSRAEEATLRASGQRLLLRTTQIIISLMCGCPNYLYYINYILYLDNFEYLNVLGSV
jgi:hypothetical protein